MTRIDTFALERAIRELPKLYPGPGGAVALVEDGNPIIRHAWGYANLETGLVFTPSTVVPICSITKQFTCATLLTLSPDLSVFDGALRAHLPRLHGTMPRTLDLANNQSGLRDYWALTVLSGAMPEGDFRPTDAARLIGLTRRLHFEPGTAYSYSNGNFRLLATLAEQVTGEDFGKLVVERITGPCGLSSAVFAPETRALPGGASGYEGTTLSGFRPAVNNIHWSGDAGLCASLDDLIAWERFIDRTRDDADGIYARLSRPVTFRDGSPAYYGMGLGQRGRWGRRMSGHGGALRGFRLHRAWLPAERLSVVVVFNHESDARGAAMHVLAAALGESDAPEPSDARGAVAFAGPWLDPETGLLLEVSVLTDGALSAYYAGHAERLSLGEDGVARSPDMSLAHEQNGLRIRRPAEALCALALPVSPGETPDAAGEYHCEELESLFTLTNAGGSWFGGFRGFLGQGPLMALTPVGRDLFRLANRRSLDAPPPGDWTVRVQRSDTGAVTGLILGCWLARNLEFVRAA